MAQVGDRIRHTLDQLEVAGLETLRFDTVQERVELPSQIVDTLSEIDGLDRHEDPHRLRDLSRMKESHAEGPASHGDPESCAGARKEAGEALTGAHMGGVLSRENRSHQGADDVVLSARQDTCGC